MGSFVCQFDTLNLVLTSLNSSKLCSTFLNFLNLFNFCSTIFNFFNFYSFLRMQVCLSCHINLFFSFFNFLNWNQELPPWIRNVRGFFYKYISVLYQIVCVLCSKSLGSVHFGQGCHWAEANLPKGCRALSEAS